MSIRFDSTQANRVLDNGPPIPCELTDRLLTKIRRDHPSDGRRDYWVLTIQSKDE